MLDENLLLLVLRLFCYIEAYFHLYENVLSEDLFLVILLSNEEAEDVYVLIV